MAEDLNALKTALETDLRYDAAVVSGNNSETTRLLNELEPGEIIQLSLAGGCGFGHPKERDRRLVMEDLRNGIISPESARAVYGLGETDITEHL